METSGSAIWQTWRAAGAKAAVFVFQRMASGAASEACGELQICLGQWPCSGVHS